MTDVKLSIFGTALASWRDGLAALRDMPTVFIGICIASFLNQALIDAVTIATRMGHVTFGWQCFIFGLLALLASFVLAPGGIAIHRYVLLDEVTSSYEFNTSSRRFYLYFVYGAVFEALLSLNVLYFEFIGTSESEVTWNEFVLAVGGIVLFLLIVAASIAALILFPAIAVDAPGANFRNAVRDAHFWRALLISIAVVLPALFAMAPVLWFDAIADGFTLRWMISAIYSSTVAALAVAAIWALASHLYRVWAIELRWPLGA